MLNRKISACLLLCGALATGPAFAQTKPVKQSGPQSVLQDAKQVIPPVTRTSSPPVLDTQDERPRGGNRYAVSGRVSRADDLDPGEQNAPAYVRRGPAFQASPAEARAALPAYYGDGGMHEEATAVAENEESTESDEEEETETWTFFGGASLRSDYVFRGYSQSDEKPALQGYVGIGHESGLSATLWASNVDFDDDEAYVEVDTILAYDFDLGPGSMSLGGAYYFYPGVNGDWDYDYGELFAVYTHSLFDELVSLAWSGYYSWDYFGGSGDAFYAEIAPTISVPVFGENTIDFNTTAGYQWIDDNDLAGQPDFWNWSAGVSHTWNEAITIGLAWHGTDVDAEDCFDLCNSRLEMNLDYDF